MNELKTKLRQKFLALGIALTVSLVLWGLFYLTLSLCVLFFHSGRD